MLPRIALFKADRQAINHVVLVDGEIMRPLCIRNPIKHGHLLSPDSRVTCNGCQTGGWMKTLGYFGRAPEKDEHGRLLDWEAVAKRQALS